MRADSHQSRGVKKKTCSQRGVSKRGNKWVVCLGSRGEQHTFGRFESEQEAIQCAQFVLACRAHEEEPKPKKVVKEKSRCPHGRLNRSECKDCGLKKAACHHGKLKKTCKHCKPELFCEHGWRANQCHKGCSERHTLECLLKHVEKVVSSW